MFKNRTIGTWLSLGALVAVLGGGLLAATTDALVAQGNEVASGTYTPDGAGNVDIVGAVVTDATQCNGSSGLTFSDGPLPAVVTGVWDLNEEAPAVQSDTVCLHNAGDAPGVVVANFVNPVSVEVGACDATEAASGDSSCADGDAGELHLSWGTETSQSCTIDPSSGRFAIPAGGYCDYSTGVRPAAVFGSGNTDTDWLAAQTDKVTFDFEWGIESTDCGDAGSDDVATAQPLSLGVPHSGTICDDDVYALSAEELSGVSSFTVDLTFLHADADLDLHVYDSTGALVTSSNDIDDNEQVTVTTVDPAGMIVLVDHFSGGTANFTLTAS